MDPKQKEIKVRYQKLVKENLPKPTIGRNMVAAFLVGGTICLIGQVILTYFTSVERTSGEAAAITLAAMIFIGAIITAFGVYDSIAEFGGAGAAVPITGFANTVVSAAMEFRREGLILGMGAKMFVIAGPVLVFGILSGFIVTLVKVAILGLFQ